MAWESLTKGFQCHSSEQGRGRAAIRSLEQELQAAHYSSSALKQNKVWLCDDGKYEGLNKIQESAQGLSMESGCNTECILRAGPHAGVPINSKLHWLVFSASAMNVA